MCWARSIYAKEPRAGVRRIVYAASGESRYGARGYLSVDKSTQVDSLSPHAVAKLAGEMYLHAYAEMYGLAPICLALANVYGPRQSPNGAAGVIAVLGSAVITGRPFAVYRDGAAAMTTCTSMTSSTLLCARVGLPSKRPGHTTIRQGRDRRSPTRPAGISANPKTGARLETIHQPGVGRADAGSITARPENPAH